VRVVSWGGAFQQALADDWWNSSAKYCGIKIEPDSWDGNYGALTTRIEKGINEWDLVHVEAQYVSNPDAASLFQSVDTDGFPIDPRIPKNARAVPLLEYGYVLAYRRDLIHNEAPPDWKDFFDTRRYPGRRAMRDFPVGNIEIALLAQGHNLDTDLYNKDLSRAQLESQVDSALDYLAKIDNDTLWWTTGDQLQRFLTSGDVAMAAAWSGRVLSAYKELCPASSVENCKLRADAHTSLVSTDWWIIPKGAPNAENAARFLSCLYENPNARSEASQFSTSQGYLASLQNLQVTDPAANYYLQIGSSGDPNIRHRISEAFWGTNFQWISNRWRNWRLKH
jgi:putative spermidine/putrescine transport system substrate-binding protein